MELDEVSAYLARIFLTIERRFHRTAPHRSLTFSGGVGELVRLNSVIVHVQCVIKLLLDNCICTLHFLWQKELLNAIKQKAFIGKKNSRFAASSPS